jgi:hypothetical protein
MKFSRTQLATLLIEVMIVVRLILAFELSKPIVPDAQGVSQPNLTEISNQVEGSL